MMHGKFSASVEHMQPPTTFWGSVTALIRRRKWLVVVVLPTLLLTTYYALIASPQYESEAHFLVRTSSGGGGGASLGGLGASLGLVGGAGISTASSDTSSVSDYLSSHEAVQELRKRANLVGIYTRPGTDIFSRLNASNPSPEKLASYFHDKASVEQDALSGITVIKVRSFRPEDSYAVVDTMLHLGEQRINILNKRAYESSLALARLQLADAEAALSSSQAAVTQFRQGRRSIDPVATGQAQIRMVTDMQADLAKARAARTAMVQMINANSPQVRAMDVRIAALQGQLSTETARMAGSGSSATAANVGDYQGLQLRQDFASKKYEDAAATLAHAREQAIKQQLFIVRVVDPNMPVKALYPKGFRVVLTVFVALTLLYACGWLIAAGVREHSV